MDRSGELRVALVDDQALIRTALGTLIEAAEKMQLVGTAGDVEAAVRLVDELHPDVVLIDVLPESGVFEGAKRILNRCPGTVVIFLDESPSDANVREALRVGAAGYLTKQQPFDQIEAALRHAAHGQRVFAPEIARRLELFPNGIRLAAEDKKNPLASLTPRETDVLVNLANGNSVKQCAKALGIETSTVGNHKTRLMKKLNVHKTVELVHLAMREGLVPGRR